MKASDMVSRNLQLDYMEYVLGLSGLNGVRYPTERRLSKLGMGMGMGASATDISMGALEGGTATNVSLGNGFGISRIYNWFDNHEDGDILNGEGPGDCLNKGEKNGPEPSYDLPQAYCSDCGTWDYSVFDFRCELCGSPSPNYGTDAESRHVQALSKVVGGDNRLSVQLNESCWQSNITGQGYHLDRITHFNEIPLAEDVYWDYYFEHSNEDVAWTYPVFSVEHLCVTYTPGNNRAVLQLHLQMAEFFEWEEFKNVNQTLYDLYGNAAGGVDYGGGPINFSSFLNKHDSPGEYPRWRVNFGWTKNPTSFYQWDWGGCIH